MPMSLGERGPRRIRLWEEARPRLGGGASASGRRRVRVWDMKRMNLGRRSPTSWDAGFATCVFWGQVGCSKSRKIKIGREATAPLKGRAFKIEISKISGSTLVAEICTDPHNRLLRRQHCSSLCSQSEGHEHVANMTNALGLTLLDFQCLSATIFAPLTLRAK